jgi:hypothetical protein
MRPHVLVEIHDVKARNIKAREPHVADNHQLQGIFRIPESLCQPLPFLLVSDVLTGSVAAPVITTLIAPFGHPQRANQVSVKHDAKTKGPHRNIPILEVLA